MNMSIFSETISQIYVLANKMNEEMILGTKWNEVVNVYNSGFIDDVRQSGIVRLKNCIELSI